MPRVARRLASLTAVLLLLSGCNDADAPDRAEPEQSSSSPTESSEAPETTSTETPPEQQSSSVTAEDPISVTLYDADFTVSADGDLTVVETLTLDVPVDDRHGIFRTFDPDHEIANFTATLDGGDTPIADSEEDGLRQFKIGDPNQTLSVGEHVVRMTYDVADALERDGARDPSFEWFLIPTDWSFDIAAAELTVHLPVAATEVACTVGRTEPCDLSGAGSTTLVVTAADLEERTPVLLQAVVPLPADA